ncbi:MAG: beta-aspartyl-peptidase (threonine type) [Bradymonadia bacterium]|jgi:beta-aspartyl-peptidase (threonine type)
MAGRDILEAGGSAVDAVCATVRALEDNPVFNAATGGALNLDGIIELDAALMVGRDRSGGAVANLTKTRHPIDVARAVMEKTDHILLAGDGAVRFARATGFPEYDCSVPDRVEAHERALERLRTTGDDWLPRLKALLDEYPELQHGTVGAVAIDLNGEFAAATSTAGFVLKLAGRVGDVAQLGAGTYATPHGAAGATGRGEIAMRLLSTARVTALTEAGKSAQEAVEAALEEASVISRDIGFIAVDGRGGIGITHGTPHMPHAFWRPAEPVQAYGRVADWPTIP